MCYRVGCKETCDDLKKMYCIMRITKKQRDFMEQILDKDCCGVCGQETVKAKYKDVDIDLCTSCGILERVI